MDNFGFFFEDFELVQSVNFSNGKQIGGGRENGAKAGNGAGAEGKKKRNGSASLVGDDWVVFNIMGNKYRLVVRIVFEYKAVQIKWFGTHKEYDKIDVSTVQHKK